MAKEDRRIARREQRAESESVAVAVAKTRNRPVFATRNRCAGESALRWETLYSLSETRGAVYDDWEEEETRQREEEEEEAKLDNNSGGRKWW